MQKEVVLKKQILKVETRKRSSEDVERVIDHAKQNGITIHEVDYWFSDPMGKTHHYQIPVRDMLHWNGEAQHWEDRVRNALTTEGKFDGSSIDGFQGISQSDMILVPDIKSAKLDPTTPDERKKLIVMCDVCDPITGLPYAKDPRIIARKAVNFLRSQEYEVDGNTITVNDVMVAPEIEFFLLKELACEMLPNKAYLEFKSGEAWGTEAGTSLPRIRPKKGYFPNYEPQETEQARSRITEALESAGIEVETHHHEVATAGQAEIDMKYSPLLQMGDTQHFYRYVARRVADAEGFKAVFLPKLMPNDNGSGMHVHQSLRGTVDGKECNLFAGEEYAGLSKFATHWVAGILEHWDMISAFAAPTLNADFRFTPGFEAPVYAVYSARNRSAGIRIPSYEARTGNPEASRIELRLADPTASLHVLVAAMCVAGHDGVKRKLEAPKPLETDVYELSPRERAKLKKVPGFTERIEALDRSRELLTSSGIFTDEYIDSFIEIAMGYAGESRKMLNPTVVVPYLDWN